MSLLSLSLNTTSHTDTMCLDMMEQIRENAQRVINMYGIDFDRRVVNNMIAHDSEGESF
jgi:hypothetical protein